MNYDDFLALVSPMNRDFTELMMQRQQDLDLQEREASYIKESVLSHQKKGEIPCVIHADSLSACRLPRPAFNFDKDGQFSHVPALFSQTFLSLILNFQRNKEIRRTYEKATKGQNVGSELLSYLPTACGPNSDFITAADILHFVSLNKQETLNQGHCHGLTFDQGGPNALQISRRLNKSREHMSPFKPVVPDTTSIKMGRVDPPSPTLSERRTMTMS